MIPCFLLQTFKTEDSQNNNVDMFVYQMVVWVLIADVSRPLALEKSAMKIEKEFCCTILVVISYSFYFSLHLASHKAPIKL